MRISDWSSDVCSSDLVRLTRYTDYSLRVLIHLALNDERLCSIGEISLTYDVSHNHLMKVVNALAHDGFIETVRGRAGACGLLDRRKTSASVKLCAGPSRDSSSQIGRAHV